MSCASNIKDVFDVVSIMLNVLQYTDDVCFVVFAFFNVAWATLYLEHWKRRSAVHAYRWGTLDKEDELLVEPRALFYVSIYHYFSLSSSLLLNSESSFYSFALTVLASSDIRVYMSLHV